MVKNKKILRILKWLSWKFQLYYSYGKEGFRDVNISFMLNELVNRECRKQNYLSYKRHLLDNFGEKIGFALADGTSIFTFTETFLDRNYTLFDDFLPKKGGTVIDIGAQHGDYSLLCAKIYHCKKVYALEPIHDNYEILLSNVARNDADGVIVSMETAVSDHDGNSELFQEGDMANSGGKGKKISCKAIRLDSLEIDEVDLLKIDVEGAEVSVIKGGVDALSRFHPRLIIETHSKLLRKTVEEYLFAIGYRLTHEGRTVVVDYPGMDTIQNLFYSFNNKSRESLGD